MRVAIVGAGPAGLYLALLLGKALPDADIVVHEQNPVDATYGFGVALHSLGWDRLREADAASCDDLLAAATITRDQIIGHRGERLQVDSSGANAGIGRLALLGVLRRHSEAAGARVVDKARIEPGALPEADLIVGADGVNSVVRATFEAAFDPVRSPQHNRLAWYGCDRKVDHPFLIFKENAFRLVLVGRLCAFRDAQHFRRRVRCRGLCALGPFRDDTGGADDLRVRDLCRRTGRCAPARQQFDLARPHDGRCAGLVGRQCRARRGRAPQR